jgi:hypothetical protein
MALSIVGSTIPRLRNARITPAITPEDRVIPTNVNAFKIIFSP